jgi:hypothetical protein
MSSTLLERARAFHEDVETYEIAIIKELAGKPRTNKDKVLQQHRISNLLGQAVQRSNELDALYEDADDAVKQEVCQSKKLLRLQQSLPALICMLERLSISPIAAFSALSA